MVCSRLSTAVARVATSATGMADGADGAVAGDGAGVVFVWGSGLFSSAVTPMTGQNRISPAVIAMTNQEGLWLRSL